MEGRSGQGLGIYQQQLSDDLNMFIKEICFLRHRTEDEYTRFLLKTNSLATLEFRNTKGINMNDDIFPIEYI